IMSLFNFLIIYILGSILLWGFYIRTMYLTRRVCFFNKKDEIPSLYISDFMYIISRKKINIIIFTLIFFSMAAIPPLPGFFQKLFILNSLTAEAYYFIIVLYLFLGVYSAYYYIRFLKITFFDKKQLKNMRLFKNPFVIIRTQKDNKNLNHLENLLFLIFLIFIYLSIDNSIIEDLCLLLAYNI
ncbi:MAG: proton-conducting transporter transmembrane domain-containing protein, partial [Methanobacterium sp.]